MGPKTRDFWSGQRPNTKFQSQSWDLENETRDPKDEI